MFALVFVILALPIISQFFLGSFSISGRLKIPYAVITKINSVAQILLIFLAPRLISIESKIEHVHREMPRSGFFIISVVVFVVFLSVIACQLIWKKSTKRRLKKERALQNNRQ
ncbi:MAG: hypothetical protein EOP06_09870 [Proteobacteria bacterium]|nr:MAG: hypothetical protein EOP06_09870 [Pseudomonadota bacterium]